MPGKSDMQVFPICHRIERAVVFDPDHFGTTCTLSLIGRHGIALTDSSVVEIQLQTRLKTYFTVITSRDGLPRAVLVNLAILLDFLG